uniref:DUF4218 domain-containing protein n=1 Tax=Lactuca sativa TaxID=4236 RepID=A0A9R1WP14_LACSA|nr:hypothetical protein LSAT_V11C100036560 [Lactuca sativa]
MERIEAEIPLILCKLETIFVPGIFNSKEHFPYEEKTTDPIQYHVKQKSRVEGSIVNAYLLHETSICCSHYFETGIPTCKKKLPQNDDGGGDEHPDDDKETLDIFSYPSHHYGNFKTTILSDEEFHASPTYILLNEDEVKHYIM